MSPQTETHCLNMPINNVIVLYIIVVFHHIVHVHYGATIIYAVRGGYIYILETNILHLFANPPSDSCMLLHPHHM